MDADYIKESFKIKDFLDELLDRKESREIEFKSAKGGFPGSFWESYSSFANTDGGTIIFGVKEKNDVFSVQPLAEETVNDFKKKFFDLQHDHEKVSLPLLTDDDLVAEKYGDGYVMAFFIPRASREQRPVYIGQNPMSGTYRRDHEGDYLCEPSTVSQMFADRKNNEVLQEARILPNYSWEDIDMDSFRQYRTLFTNLTPSHPWTVKEDLELMKLLGGYRRDRKTGEEGFTLAGLLMFGKTEAITDVACLPDFMLDYREVPEDTSITRWTDRLYPDGTWECNLFQFYRRVLPKLFSFLPKPFILKGDERQDESPAHEAVREAFINCVVHSCFSRSPRIVIEKRPASIMMRNPGTLLISLEQYYEGGHSECRNPSLQKMFGLIGRSDKAGSGVDKIMEGWKFAKWRRPYVNEKSHPDVVELFLPLESLFSESTMDELIKTYGANVKELPHQQLTVLAFALSEGTISNSSLQNVVELHPSDITKLLRHMCMKGYLISTGLGRGTTYKLNPDYFAPPDPTSYNPTSCNPTSCYPTSCNPTSCNPTGSDSASSNTPSSDAPSSDAPSSDAPSSDAPSPEETQMVCEYCKQWRKISDISNAIGRSRQHTQKRILRKLIQEGKIEMEYPEQPTHPAQRYRIVKHPKN